MASNAQKQLVIFFVQLNIRSFIGKKMFVCLDDDPETIQGGAADLNGALFYLTEARCGPLPCPNYVDGRELTCVVCSL